MEQFKYYNPVKIHFGSGKINEINQLLGNRRALLVTSRGFSRRGMVDKLKSLTPGIVQVIDTVEANPDFVGLKSNYDLINHKDIDVVVALGGGSVIDSAKVLSVYFSSPSFDLVEKLIRQGDCSLNYSLKPVIAIPTTAGTGSEVTPWATVWDTAAKKKFSLHLQNLWPEACICDPELTLTMGRELTIQTALDALSHSLESIWNKNANPISTQLAVSSASGIIKNLPELVNKLNDLDCREKIMLAALKAGLAFSNTQTAVAHAMSYYITAHKGICHGLACSFALPDIIDVAAGTNETIDNSIKEIFGELSGNKLRQCYNELGVSTAFTSYGLTSADLKDLKKSLLNVTRAQNSLVNVDKLFCRLGSN